MTADDSSDVDDHLNGGGLSLPVETTTPEDHRESMSSSGDALLLPGTSSTIGMVTIPEDHNDLMSLEEATEIHSDRCSTTNFDLVSQYRLPVIVHN